MVMVYVGTLIQASILRSLDLTIVKRQQVEDDLPIQKVIIRDPQNMNLNCKQLTWWAEEFLEVMRFEKMRCSSADLVIGVEQRVDINALWVPVWLNKVVIISQLK